MAASFDRMAFAFAIVLAASCSEEDGPHTPRSDDDEGEEGASGKQDAGRDSGSDARAEDDDSNDDDSEDEAENDSDSGSETTVDAGSRDSGSRDAGSRDSGRADAGSDARGGDARTGDAASADAAGGGDACDELTYESFGQEFMDTYCLTCHGENAETPPENPVQVDTLEGIVASSDRIQAAAVASDMMPPRGLPAPSQEEREQLGQWLDCGAN